ncbi:MAG: shikimate dehydrogenase [Eubacteriales bacterium]|nr:shikimate dehydrogenase [Eubacteriales bacterium]
MSQQKSQLNGYTELVGLMAYPIRHTQSPRMHNEAFAQLGYNIIQLAFEVDQTTLADAVQSIRALKMRGSNVSMPNKTVVHQYLDEIDRAAELCGAVNTIVNRDGKLIGYNTDGMGYMKALEDKGFDVIGKKMTIVGGGGAATAIQIQAALQGVKEISIFNKRDAFWPNILQTVETIRTHTDCKAELYDLDDQKTLREQIEDSVLFANATNLGMKPMEGMCCLPDESYLRPDLLVTDVVYAPPKTPLLEMAERVGCRWMNGLNMMLFQGSAAFELWMGQPMPIGHMKRFLGIEDGK